MRRLDLQVLWRARFGLAVLALFSFARCDGAPISAQWEQAPPEGVAILAQHYQVLQRDKMNEGTCFIEMPSVPFTKGCVYQLRIIGPQKRKIFEKSFPPAAEDRGSSQGIHVEHLPMGGPYAFRWSPTAMPKKASFDAIQEVRVGDLWVLAGQSNMQGVFAPEEQLPINPLINMLDRPTERWMPASDPVHHLVGSYARDIVRGYQGKTEAEYDQIRQSGAAMGGVNAANFFARELVKQTGVPVGLIPCALGGPPLDLWSPERRNEPDSLYSVMLRHVRQAGGRVRGMLWYQGESDALSQMDRIINTYRDRFEKFVKAVRQDFNDPELPIFTAQICRYLPRDPKADSGYEGLREQQRRAADTIPNVYMAATVDLDLGDGVHIDPASQKRLGARWAWLAVPHVKKDVPPRSGIKLTTISLEQPSRKSINLEFSGPSAPFKHCSRALGFEIRDAKTSQTLPLLHRVDFDAAHPGRIILRLNGVPSDVTVVYAPGANPPANITDENDMALPGFGPVRLFNEVGQ